MAKVLYSTNDDTVANAADAPYTSPGPLHFYALCTLLLLDFK